MMGFNLSALYPKAMVLMIGMIGGLLSGMLLKGCHHSPPWVTLDVGYVVRVCSQAMLARYEGGDVPESERTLLADTLRKTVSAYARRHRVIVVDPHQVISGDVRDITEDILNIMGVTP